MRILPLFLATGFALLFSPVYAESPASADPVLNPFVEKHELAGAVGIIAGKNRDLSVVTVAQN